MSFTSFQFLWVFPLFVLFYNLVTQKYRAILLLITSYLFYLNMQPVLFIMLLIVTALTYFSAHYITHQDDDDKRVLGLRIGVVCTLLPLLFFKYFNFLANTLVTGLQLIGLEIHPITTNFVLPIGISFYTFMAIGYLVDVFNEEVEFEPNYISVSLFLSFFPYILSGPIERAGNMFEQFKNLKRSTWNGLVSGLKLMLWGYFMKLCIADRLALYNDLIFTSIPNRSGSTLAIASLLYPIQVYADLGGYTLIVMGISKCLGIKIIPNFNRPFLATSISEFWRRWHISLIKWLTDYIFTPLSFTLRSWKLWGIITALMLTFFISGIWHGASFCFIFWGLMQGALLSFEAYTNPKRNKFEEKYHLRHKGAYNFICILFVYFVFAFTEIWDKEGVTWNETMLILHKIFHEWGTPYLILSKFLYASIAFIPLLFSELRNEYKPERFLFFDHKNIFIRWTSYLIILFMILTIGVLNSSQFIYFQF